MREDREFRPGDRVKHFKHDLLDHPGTKYLYRIIDVATHTETGEKFVVYQSLYDDEKLHISYGQTFVRPYDMFISEVDHSKYPNTKQKYRFEKVWPELSDLYRKLKDTEMFQDCFDTILKHLHEVGNFHTYKTSIYAKTKTEIEAIASVLKALAAEYTRAEITIRTGHMFTNMQDNKEMSDWHYVTVIYD